MKRLIAILNVSRRLTLISVACVLLLGLVAATAEARHFGGAAHRVGGSLVSASPATVLSTVTPGHGAPGDVVTLTGSNFGSGSVFDTVEFGYYGWGRNTSWGTGHVLTWTDTSITCKVPDIAPGAYIVWIEWAGFQNNQSNHLPFTADMPTPVLTTTNPGSVIAGSGAVTLTITGSSFYRPGPRGSVVLWNAIDLATSYVSGTSLTAAVPAALVATPGTAQITVRNGSGTSAKYSTSKAFTVEAPASAPHIASLTPNHGLPAASVIVAGSGFGATQGASSVKFGATAAAVTSWSDTSITCQVPPLAAAATTVAVTVGAQTSNAAPFTVEAPMGVPKITLKLGGLHAGALALGLSVTAKCTLRPSSLAGESCRLTVQKKMKGYGWMKVTTKAGSIDLTGTYSWRYKPATRGSFRMQATIAATAQHTSAKSPWRAFKVK